jgi:hypothetical protein
MSLTRLRIGQRVQPTDAGEASELGRVALRLERDEHDCDCSPYLVLWEAGGESRCERSSIRPVGLDDPVESRERRGRPSTARRA